MSTMISTDTVFCHYKMTICANCRALKSKILKTKLFRQSPAKNIGKIVQVEKKL